MAGPATSLLQGTLDLLILRALSLGGMHGLGISRRIEQMSRGTFKVRPRSLFPALHRMAEAGWRESSWGESENRGRAKFYRLSAAGRRQLKSETAAWGRVSMAIELALRARSAKRGRECGGHGWAASGGGSSLAKASIRMALGARTGEVVGLVLGQGMRTVAIGAACGLVGGLGLGTTLSGLPYGVRPADPLTLGAVVLVLGPVPLVAMHVPVRHAAAVRAMESLRHE